MKVSLDFITPDAEGRIGKYAAICYDSKTDKETCVKRAIKCRDSGHLATLRFAHATFLVEDISRACANQFVRSKHLDFLQQSQRYVNQSSASFVYPDTKEDTLISSAYQTSMARYNELIAKGVKKEDARLILPLGISTTLYVTGNLQAWRDFLKLREDEAAQWEINAMAKEIRKLLSLHCPNLF